MEIRILIKRVLDEYHATLINLPKESLKDLADEMFFADIISTGVQKAPTFDNIIEEFKTGMTFKRTLTELQEYLVTFLTSLKNVRGSFAGASDCFRKEWTQTIKKELKIELDLTAKSEEKIERKRQRSRDTEPACSKSKRRPDIPTIPPIVSILLSYDICTDY